MSRLLAATFLAALIVSIGVSAGALLFVGSTYSADAPAKADAAAPKSAAEIAADMVHRNGAIFEDWPTPKAAIVVTGLQAGYIEPCGCSGKENQKGGLSRRDMLLQWLAGKKWPIVTLDLGQQVRRFGRLQELKYQATADALKTMGYQAIAFGPEDLRLSTSEMFAIVSPVGNQPSPFIAANVGLYGFDEKILPGFKVIDAGGLKIGVAAVLGDSFCQTLNNQDVKTTPSAQRVKAIMPKLKAANCDLNVLLAHATPGESKVLAKQFPEFNVVVTAGGAEEPPAKVPMLPGTQTQYVELGSKGKYAIVLGLYDDGKTITVRSQRVPLDARFGESPRMIQALATYEDQLKELGLEGLGLKPRAEGDGHAQFVGSQVCAVCHTKAYAIWRKTPHAKALDTLAHLEPSRQFDPECLSCHVTGWDPQRYFPYSGGYLNIEKTPQLVGNGCENCHGPGSAHVAAEAGDKASAADLQRLQGEMRLSLTTDAARKKAIGICLQCHDGDNSIDFHGGEAFDQYWKKVEHHGKD